MNTRLITNKVFYKTGLFLKKNSSTILSIAGVAGVVVTAIATSKATINVAALLEDEREQKGEDLTRKEIIRTAVPKYIPSALLGLSTVGCILGANIISRRQQASLASACALLSSSYKDYRNKVIELYGKDKDDEVRAAIARDKYLADPPTITAYGFGGLTGLTEISNPEDLVLFYETASRRYFESTISEVQAAEYHLNRNFALRGCAPLNEFYEFLGIPPTDFGEILGWSMCEGYGWIDFDHKKAVLDDGLECYIIGYEFEPTAENEDY